MGGEPTALLPVSQIFLAQQRHAAVAGRSMRVSRARTPPDVSCRVAFFASSSRRFFVRFAARVCFYVLMRLWGVCMCDMSEIYK